MTLNTVIIPNISSDIDNYIMLHQMWKAKLRKYITDCNRDIDLNELRHDDSCDFSKWLSELPSPFINDENLLYYSKLKIIHCKFHQVASDIVEFILSGNEAKAKHSIEFGDFLNISARLILTLLEWKKHLGYK